MTPHCALRALTFTALVVLPFALGCAQGSALDASGASSSPGPEDAAPPQRDATLPPSEAGSPPASPPDAATPDAALLDDGASPEASPLDAGAPDSAPVTPDAGTDASLSSTIPVGAAVGSCTPSAWTMTASISQPANPPAYAADGLAPTRWSTGAPQAIGDYLQVDFGGYVVLDHLVLDDSYGPNERSDFPRGFEVLGSNDGTTFGATVAAVPALADAGASVTTSFAPVAVRAARIQLTSGDPGQWWSVHELRAGCQAPGQLDAGSPGLPGGACGGDAGAWTAGAGIATTGWTATASSTASPDTIAAAFDRDAATRWSNGSAQNGGEWFRLDLGAAQSLSEVELYLLGSDTTDFPSAYLLELSTDDVTYTPVAKGTGALVTAVCFPQRTARYVRVTQIGSGSTEWWAIFEMNVFH